MGPDVCVDVTADVDVVVARQEGRAMAAKLGMSTSLQTMVATAISELARNIVVYASRGEIHLSVIEDGTRQGVQVVARDRGPGIDDIDRAMQDGYSTVGSLGLGLPGARRLMDDFEITSSPDGTAVTIRKWQVTPR